MFFFKSDNVSIIFVHSHVLSHISLVDFEQKGYIINDKNTILFISFSWYYNGKDEGLLRELNCLKIPYENVYAFMNSYVELKQFELDFPACNAYLVNNACWVDYDTFYYNPQVKLYDAIMNSKVQPFKRHYLCQNVNNTCIVTYGDKEIVQEVKELLKPKYINETTLSYKNVVILINQSYCGLILSEEEGACYASAEYLSCGIPVVTTPSRGGRNVFLDDSNSLTCDPTVDSVKNMVELITKTCRSGGYNAKYIRKKFIVEAKAHRKVFIDVLQSVFDRFDETTNARDYVANIYQEKLSSYRITTENVDEIIDYSLMQKFYDFKIQTPRTIMEDIVKDMYIVFKGRTNLLIFGTGYDTPFWIENNLHGKTIIIEHNMEWANLYLNKYPDNIIHYPYDNVNVADTKNLTDLSILDYYTLPKEIQDIKWDIVIVDGPTGYDDSCPGRALPLYWSVKKLIHNKSIVVVDDTDRSLEDKYVKMLFDKNHWSYYRYSERPATIKLNQNMT